MSPKRQEKHESWPVEQVIHLQILPVPNWKVLPFGSNMQGEFWGSVPCKQSSTHESSDVSYEIFEVVHPNPQELLYISDIFGALKGIRYTPELSWRYFIKDSLHLTRFFLRWVGLVHQSTSDKVFLVTCVDTRMDFQHKVEHPKVSRNRGFCSDLDQGDVKDEIYQYVSLVFMDFMERPV